MSSSAEELRAAAAKLRGLVAALPEDFRQRWVVAGEGAYVIPTPNPSAYVVAHSNFGAQHIALAASPPTVLLLAAWLETSADGWAKAEQMVASAPAVLASLQLGDPASVPGRALAFARAINGTTGQPPAAPPG